MRNGERGELGLDEPVAAIMEALEATVVFDLAEDGSRAKAEMTGRLQTLAGVSTPGHGQGEGPARYELRVSGTK